MTQTRPATPDDSETSTNPSSAPDGAPQSRTGGGPGLPARLLAGLAFLALLPRIVNLGSFSMWFDEVVQTLQTRGSLAETWAALKSDVVHPPLEGLLTWILLHLGMGETARRLVPIAFGIATVLLLASWTARRFGRIAGIATGLFAAGAPIHIHYSQELRPYSLAMLCGALAMVAVDRLLDHVDGRRLALAGLAILACLYSLYFAVLVLGFVGWLILDTAVTGKSEEARRARRVLAWSPVVLLGVGLAYLPWISTLLAIRQQRIQREANNWTWETVAERWQVLTVGSETSFSVWGGALVLFLVVLGSARALRTAAGRAVLIAALCGTLGIDLLLLYADHWSSDRYNLMGWLFLAVLAGMGTDLLARLPGGRAVPAAALLLLAVAQVPGIVSDHQSRQDWRRVAEAVHELWRPGEPVLALNQSTRIPLLYYLHELGSPAVATVASVDGSHRRLAQIWPGDRCALLVLRRRGRTGRVVQLTRSAEELAFYPASGARLRLLTPRFRERVFRRRGEALSLGRATPEALKLHCQRELSPALRASRADHPYDPLLRLLGLRS